MNNLQIKSLVRPNILNLQPYSSARHEFEGKADCFLDANENAYGSAVGEYNRYPDPLQHALKKRLAALKNIAAENIFIGNGSDEVIDLAIRIFCEPVNDNIIICPPTYGMYAVSAAINNVGIIKVPLGVNFEIRTKEILQAANQHSKILFICSPNNPTGNSMCKDELVALLQQFPGIVIIDEAYIDYSPQASLLQVLSQFPNLIIMQTLSKAWGLAGLRLGIGFASGDIISLFNKVKPPYNVNAASQQLALEALENVDLVSSRIQQTILEKQSLVKAFRQLAFVEALFESDANFILVKCKDADDVYRWLLGKCIVVRNRSKEPGCDNCLRITIGTPAENNQLVNMLKNYDANTKQ